VEVPLVDGKGLANFGFVTVDPAGGEGHGGKEGTAEKKVAAGARPVAVPLPPRDVPLDVARAEVDQVESSQFATDQGSFLPQGQVGLIRPRGTLTG